MTKETTEVELKEEGIKAILREVARGMVSIENATRLISKILTPCNSV